MALLQGPQGVAHYWNDNFCLYPRALNRPSPLRVHVLSPLRLGLAEAWQKPRAAKESERTSEHASGQWFGRPRPHDETENKGKHQKTPSASQRRHSCSPASRSVGLRGFRAQASWVCPVSSGPALFASMTSGSIDHL